MTVRPAAGIPAKQVHPELETVRLAGLADPFALGIDREPVAVRKERNRTTGLLEAAARIRPSLYLKINSCTSNLIARRCHGCGRVHTAKRFRCRHRLCHVCAPFLALEKSDKITAAVLKLDRRRLSLWHITVSPVRSVDPLTDDVIVAMRDAFRRWTNENKRRRLVFTGMIRKLEFTYTPAGWHPHFHLLVIEPKQHDNTRASIGARVARLHELVSGWWRECSGLNGEGIAWVRPEDFFRDDTRLDKAVREVAKYAAKPFDDTAAADPAGAPGPFFLNRLAALYYQLIPVLERKKIFECYGIFRKIKADEDEAGMDLSLGWSCEGCGAGEFSAVSWWWDDEAGRYVAREACDSARVQRETGSAWYALRGSRP